MTGATAKLDHIVINASDLAASVKFYDAVLTVLGFEKTREFVWLNDARFAIDLRAATSASAYDRYGPGANHIGFGVPSMDALNLIIANLNDAFGETPPVQIIDGAHCLFLPDPDGLRLEITWEPPASTT